MATNTFTTNQTPRSSVLGLHTVQCTALLQVEFARNAVVSVTAATVRALQDGNLVIVGDRRAIQAMTAAGVTPLAVRHNQLMMEPSLGRRQMGGRVIRARRLERVNIDPAALVAVWCADPHL